MGRRDKLSFLYMCRLLSPPLATRYGLFSHREIPQFSVDSSRGHCRTILTLSTRTECQALKSKSSGPRTLSILDVIHKSSLSSMLIKEQMLI